MMYYTCSSKVRSSLRVESKYWNGVKLYSGITEDTILSPVHMNLPEVAERKMTDSTCNVAEDALKPNSSVTDQPFSDESESKTKNNFIRQDNSWNPEYRCSPRPQTVPLVSWNERPLTDKSEETKRRSVKVISYKIFEIEQRRNPRPLTAGVRIVVPPRNNCPSGLTSEDVIHGRKLFSSSHRDPLELHINGQAQTEHNEVHWSADDKYISSDTARNRSTAIPRHVQSASTNRRQVQDRHVARPHTTPNPKRSVTFELQIKSLGALNRTENPKDESMARYTSKIMPDYEKNKDKNMQVKKIRSAMDNLEMKRRVQSAPPNNKMNVLIQNTENAKEHFSAKASPLEERKFSNIYWRAKSSYHKKMADIENEAGTSDSPQKGTLLRPLLYNDDRAVMKHSAGCPYKCKECFKACLVSEDFLDTQSRLNAQKVAVKRPINPDPLAIVHRALARSQPIFKHVYGDTFDVNVRPWPTYAWVDIRQTLQKET